MMDDFDADLPLSYDISNDGQFIDPPQYKASVITADLGRTISGDSIMSLSSQSLWGELQEITGDDLHGLEPDPATVSSGSTGKELPEMSPHDSVPTSSGSSTTTIVEAGLGKRKSQDDADTSFSSIPRKKPTIVEVGLGKRKSQDDADVSFSSIPRKKPHVSKSSSVSLERRSIPKLPDPKPPSDDLDEPVVIAHSPNLQGCLKSRDICFGVEYEAWRLISVGALAADDVLMDDLDSLKGSNEVAAPLTVKTLVKNIEHRSDVSFAKELAAKTPWAELDKEEAQLAKNPLAGLGFDQDGIKTDFYGGKVHFRAKLIDENRSYKLVLERAELGSSSRFMRRFGSKSFLNVKIPSRTLRDPRNDLLEFFRRPFVLGDHVYRAIYAKDSNVFLFRVNEVYDGHTVSPGVPGARFSFLDFVQWHNPLEFNSSQTMAKWASRFALGLSNTVPGLKLRRMDIKEEVDIKSATGSDMTDGCGFINAAGLRYLQSYYEWPSFPTAIQVRIVTNKGLLLRHPTDDSETPTVWIRPSQTKVVYPRDQPLDDALLIIDILRSSHLQTPSRLGTQTIINLAENGVLDKVFVKLISNGIEAIIKNMVTWEETEESMRNLWVAVARCGGVLSARRARESVGEARVRGYGERDSDDLENDDEDDLTAFALKEQSSAWWGDETSGCPSSLEETVMVLLDTNFKPSTCPVLREKLKQVIFKAIRSYVRSYRLDVPMSATAWMVPDPCDVLEPGQIHFKSSQRNFLNADGKTMTDILLGDVLVTRYPCMLPTDIMKMKAVEHPALRNVLDVIVFSTRGTRRPADYLAGGDYDGDKDLVIWQPEIVESFTNADLKYADPPPGIMDHFVKENEHVSDFVSQRALWTEDIQRRKLQQYLLGGIQTPNLVGQYSSFHTTALYTLGYTHPETIRLAYMFCMVLDASKTGLRVLPATFTADSKLYSKRPPKWKETEEEEIRFSRRESNEGNLGRPRNLGKFIMDIIFNEARKQCRSAIEKIESEFKEFSTSAVADPDLTAPWNMAKEQANRWDDRKEPPLNPDGTIDTVQLTSLNPMRQDLDKIQAHVHVLFQKHRQHVKPVGKGPRKDNSGAAFTELSIQDRQDALRALSKEFASKPEPYSLVSSEPVTAARLRASYAYIHDLEQRKSHKTNWTRFPWDLAMRELCDMKARASPRGHKTISQWFYDYVHIKRTPS